MLISCATRGLVNEYLKMNLRIIKIVIKLPKALNIAVHYVWLIHTLLLNDDDEVMLNVVRCQLTY